MKNELRFPEGFYWGAATASHQVEGGHINDWTEWEVSPAREAFLHANGEVEKYGLQNFVSGKACDHRTFFKDDFRLAKELGHNATRFSIEWSRIEPEEGKFDLDELQHYKNVIYEVRQLGIEPFVTLWHWPVPLWLRDKGGWECSQVAEYFARFVEQVVATMGDEVTFWITLNEPEVYAGNSYIAGIWPPQVKNPLRYLRVTFNQIAAHRKAYDVIHRLQPKAQVGIAKNNCEYEPYGNTLVNRLVVVFADWWANKFILNRIADKQDFIGLNHYFHLRLDLWRVKNENALTSDMGWELYPSALHHVLVALKRYGKPVYITENGLADATDTRRGWFLLESLKSVHRALTDGVDIRGYLHWSLMDNFEWDKGFWPRFGLIEITENLERKPRASSVFYKEICEANAITDEIVARHRYTTELH